MRSLLDQAEVLGAWRDEAACRGKPTDLWFSSRPHEIAQARAVCAACPVARECAEHADRVGEHGMWGGIARKLGRSQDPRGRERRCTECEAPFRSPGHRGRPRAQCSRRCKVRARDRQKRAESIRSGKTTGRFLGNGHGTITRYQDGCRCESCRYAGRVARREYR